MSAISPNPCCFILFFLFFKNHKAARSTTPMTARIARITPAIPPLANFFIICNAAVAAGVAPDVAAVGELVSPAVGAGIDDEVVELATALDVCVSCVDVVAAADADAVVATTERLLSPVLTSQIRYVKGAGSVVSVAW